MTEENKVNNTDDGEAANKKKGAIIIAVIVGGALYVGVSPFIGAMLPREPVGGPQEQSQVQVQHVSQAPRADQVQQMPVTPLSQTAASTPSTDSSLKHSDILAALRSTSTKEPMSKRFAESLTSTSSSKGIQVPDNLLSSASVKTPVTAPVTAPASAPVMVANADYERSLKNITSLCGAGKNEAGLKAADEFIATLNRDPGALPKYKIVTVALAMQMAADTHQKARAQTYGEIGLMAARDHDDYFMERLEPLYYSIQGGSTVDFAKAESLLEQCQAELASGTRQKLPQLGREVLAATETLPDRSFYRLQARVMNAYGEFVQSGNPAAAIEAFEAIKRTARAAGDHTIAKKCEVVVALIRKQQK